MLELANLVLVRIDDRLIHGQVATAWVKVTRANKIIIVDDAVAQDFFIVKVLKMAAPQGIKVEVSDINTAIEVLKKSEESTDKIMILAKTPKTIYEMMLAGIEIKELNIGGMGAGPGRKQVYKNISASPEEKEVLKKIVDLGTDVFIRIVPDDNRIAIKNYIQ